MRLALDDFGDGRSSLRLWSEARPDFVKSTNTSFTISSHIRENLQMLRAIRALPTCSAPSSWPKALKPRTICALRDLDIPYGQGWLLGRPTLTAQHALQVPPWRSCRTAASPSAPSGPILPPRNPAWSSSAAGADGHAGNAERHHCTPVHAPYRVACHRAAGRRSSPALINRQQFMNHYATLYFREVHGRKPCLAFANPRRAWWSSTAMSNSSSVS